MKDTAVVALTTWTCDNSVCGKIAEIKTKVSPDANVVREDDTIPAGWAAVVMMRPSTGADSSSVRTRSRVGRTDPTVDLLTFCSQECYQLKAMEDVAVNSRWLWRD